MSFSFFQRLILLVEEKLRMRRDIALSEHHKRPQQLFRFPLKRVDVNIVAPDILVVTAHLLMKIFL